MSQGFVDPHDSRYGRLFTDGDVGNILTGALEHFGIPKERLAELNIGELGHVTFAVGEPMYLLAASDPLAWELLRIYDELLQKASEEGAPGIPERGVPGGYREHIELAIGRFDAWPNTTGEET